MANLKGAEIGVTRGKEAGLRQEKSKGAEIGVTRGKEAGLRQEKSKGAESGVSWLQLLRI